MAISVGWRAVAVSLGTAAAFAACGSSSITASRGSGTTEVEQVAVAYTRDTLAGDIEAARQYVAPASQNAFKVIMTAFAHTKVSSQDLRAGSATIRGRSAVVVLTGKLCNGTSCVTNTSPSSSNPIFKVEESRVGSRWMVTFDQPGGGAAPPATTATGSSVPAQP